MSLLRLAALLICAAAMIAPAAAQTPTTQAPAADARYLLMRPSVSATRVTTSFGVL